MMVFNQFRWSVSTPTRCDVRQRIILYGILLGLMASGIGLNAKEAVDFDLEVRPILADACFRCHGPDENTREADLRLDMESELLSDRGGYRIVEPGDPAESHLLQRIRGEGEERMPPFDAQRQLTEDEISTLTRWVEEGADWKQHWAFEKPVAS
ncbi:MAG: c-type cytochrome domain-containing protein, partial [Planctomycetota bacterium]|nr:c-type cytochrome domain-containing protein [Planctomycetota bacterium]